MQSKGTQRPSDRTRDNQIATSAVKPCPKFQVAYRRNGNGDGDPHHCRFRTSEPLVSISQEEIQGSSCRRQICDLCASSREKRCIEHSMSHIDYKASYTTFLMSVLGRVFMNRDRQLRVIASQYYPISSAQLNYQTHLLSPRTQRGIDQPELKHPIIHFHQLKYGR
jgi:hypothetical protein